MAEEFGFHLDLERQKLERQGMSPADARREAARRFGDLALVGDACRDVMLDDARSAPPATGWSVAMIWMDVKHAVRLLGREPGFVAVVVGTLTLGIGAMTAVFSVLEAVVLNPLPYADPHRLVRVYTADDDAPDERVVMAVPDVVDLRDGVGAFEHLAGFYTYSPIGYDLTGHGAPRRVTALPVTSGYFEALGATPLLGRTFRREEEIRSPEETTWIAGGVVILSHRLWREYTNADPDVIGTRITMNGVDRTVIGVMRPTFRDVTPEDAELWVPQGLDPGNWNHRGNQYLSALARIRPGVSLAAAQAEADAFNLTLRERYPDTNADRNVRLVPLYDAVVGTTPGRVYVLFGAAAFVLLIASVNVANLFLARSLAHQREFAIRAALGGGVGRLIQGRLVESVVLGCAGGTLGLAVAWGGVRALLAVSPESVARAEEVGFDGALLAFAFGLSLVTALLFGLTPAWRSARVSPAAALRDSARGTTEAAHKQQARNVLAAAQVALALMLLVGAGLLIKGFARLQGLQLGFDPRNVTAFEVHLPDRPYASAERRALFHVQLQERMRATPGVRAAGAVSRLPATGSYHPWGFSWESADGDRTRLRAQVRVVEGDYFEAMGIPLLRGRLFGPTDRADVQHVALITESAVERGFADRDPIGTRINITGREFQVIGVVGDVAYGARGDMMSSVYLSHTQYAANRNWALTQVVAATEDHRAVANAAIQAVAALDPDLVVYNVRGMEDVLAREIAEERFMSLLMAVFAGVAVSLAAIGLYGVLSYTVSQRTQEIGIRLALGARAAEVLRAVVGRAAMLAGIGIVVGLGATWALARAVGSVLFGVNARDPSVFVVVTAGLAVVALMAGYIPARRATRVDPMRALRGE